MPWKWVRDTSPDDQPRHEPPPDEEEDRIPSREPLMSLAPLSHTLRDELLERMKQTQSEQEAALTPVRKPPVSRMVSGVYDRMRREAQKEAPTEQAAPRTPRKAPVSQVVSGMYQRLRRDSQAQALNAPPAAATTAAAAPIPKSPPKGPTSIYQRLRPDAYKELGGAVIEAEDEESAPGFLQICWPLLFGLMLCGLAPQLHAYVVDHWADTGERLVFPYMLLSGRPELGLGEELRASLPQLFLYLPFPIFGFYVSLSMYKRTRLGTALAHVVFLNLIAAFVLWLLSQPGASHGL